MPTPNIPQVQTANTFDFWRIQTNNLINAANELRSTTYDKEAGLLLLSNTVIGTALLVSGNARVDNVLTVNTLIAANANITGNLVSSNANITHTLRATNGIFGNVTAGNVDISGTLSLGGVNITDGLSQAANTVSISLNGLNALSKKKLNFKNSATVTFSVVANADDADITATSSGGGGGGTGPQGAQGAPGAQGPSGAAGATGATGSAGATGATGAVGPSGPQGRQGATGPSTLINAAQDTSSNPLYPVLTAGTGDQTPKITTTRLSFNANDGTLTATRFVGDGSGITGIAGGTGPSGPSGPQGRQGTAGTNGTNGTNGSPGATGATGPSGPSGPAGTNGTNGSPGTNGTNGSPGAPGPSNVINATNDTSSTTLYPVLVGPPADTNQTAKISTSKLSYNANDGTLTATRLNATNDITAFVSDDRLKDRLYNIGNALSTVETLNGFFFKFNDTAKNLGYDYDGRMVGVSAQEVQKVLPEVIAKAPIDNQYLTVHYEKLVPLLIEAIKELKKEVDELKNRL